MSAEQLDIELLLTKFHNGVSESEKDEMVDKLETAIIICNKATNAGQELVSDAVYDVMVDYLKELKPTSPLLKQVWSNNDENTAFDEDLDKYLTIYPMLSINTVKDISDKFIESFKHKMSTSEEIVYSMKLNGHGIRIVLQYGFIKKATTRGRSTNGRDITSIVHMIIGSFIEGLQHYEHVELRCEVVLDMTKLEEARKYNPTIKSAFTAVASLIRESTTEAEAKLLDIVCFDIISDEFLFKTLTDKFELLTHVGLKVPFYRTATVHRVSLHEDIEDAIFAIEELTDDYEFYTDGVVATVNNTERFMEFGSEDKYRLGNMALKIGKWRQDTYTGVIESIKWKMGKSRLTPVAVLEGDGVLTSTGNKVKNVPVYAPVYLLILEAYIGNVINFRYGGEAGVVPVTPDGRLVTEVTRDGFDLDRLLEEQGYYLQGISDTSLITVKDKLIKADNDEDDFENEAFTDDLDDFEEDTEEAGDLDDDDFGFDDFDEEDE